MLDEQNKKQLEGIDILVKLAEEQKQMSITRTQLSAQRSYHNAERTLSVWLRTALAAMVFGIAIDRFGLMFSDRITFSGNPSLLIGTILIFFSILMVISAAIRFIGFTRVFKKQYPLPAYHTSSLPVAYSIMITIFGLILLLLMLGLL